MADVMPRPLDRALVNQARSGLAPSGFDHSRGAITRLADAMEAEGVYQIRRYQNGTCTVELYDGRTGQGKTPRAAIMQASNKPAPKVAR